MLDCKSKDAHCCQSFYISIEYIIDGISKPKKLIVTIKTTNLVSRFNITDHFILVDLNINELNVIRK